MFGRCSDHENITTNIQISGQPSTGRYNKNCRQVNYSRIVLYIMHVRWRISILFYEWFADVDGII